MTDVEKSTMGATDAGAIAGKCTLVSQEGTKFELNRSTAVMSVLVKEMIDEEEGEDSNPEIPLPNVKSAVLEKVIEFCEVHIEQPMAEIEKPLASANMAEVVSEWYAKFIDLEQELIFELILAANYMDIKPLLDLTCAKVASMIKGKSPEEIREHFNIPNDFTPQEEMRLREENQWCGDA
mmetsp:Transcript_10215/g.18003  ORF Transcript_10215/g.18003 Transcript_10215/m.18003 type:complete len:180 (+) Transcript_10215:179-718(+)